MKVEKKGKKEKGYGEEERERSHLLSAQFPLRLVSLIQKREGKG